MDGDRREARWTAGGVAIAAGVGGLFLVLVSVGLITGPLRRRRVCAEYAADFRREVEEGRIRYADATERLARAAGCSWARQEVW